MKLGQTSEKPDPNQVPGFSLTSKGSAHVSIHQSAPLRPSHHPDRQTPSGGPIQSRPADNLTGGHVQIPDYLPTGHAGALALWAAVVRKVAALAATGHGTRDTALLFHEQLAADLGGVSRQTIWGWQQAAVHAGMLHVTRKRVGSNTYTWWTPLMRPKRGQRFTVAPTGVFQQLADGELQPKHLQALVRWSRECERGDGPHEHWTGPRPAQRRNGHGWTVLGVSTAAVLWGESPKGTRARRAALVEAGLLETTQRQRSSPTTGLPDHTSDGEHGSARRHHLGRLLNTTWVDCFTGHGSFSCHFSTPGTSRTPGTPETSGRASRSLRPPGPAREAADADPSAHTGSAAAETKLKRNRTATAPQVLNSSSRHTPDIGHPDATQTMQLMLNRHDLTRVGASARQREQLAEIGAARLTEGWTPPALERQLTDALQRASTVKYLIGAWQPERLPRQVSSRRHDIPTWCGQCYPEGERDWHARFVDVRRDDGVLASAKCPECHPDSAAPLKAA